MIVTITHNEIRQGQRGDYLYIKYATEKGKEGAKAVFQELKGKWDLCRVNAVVDLKLDAKFNVIDILQRELPPPQPAKTIPIPGEEIPKAESKAVAPQAIGMTCKELGDMIRAKQLSVIFGQEMAEKLVAWYKSQILENTCLKSNHLVEAAKKSGGEVVQ